MINNRKLKLKVVKDCRHLVGKVGLFVISEELAYTHTHHQKTHGDQKRESCRGDGEERNGHLAG